MRFENDDALKAWLRTQSQEVRVAIATRAALRVMPIVAAHSAWKDTDEARKRQESLVLWTARCSLISGVASTCPTPEIKSAARSAVADAALSARSALSALSAALSDAVADAALSAAALGKDCDVSPGEMFRQPLWHDADVPEGLRPADLGPKLFDTDPRFAFFARWYDGMVRGEPLPWDLQERVALIPGDTWEAGADAVAKAIAAIERALRTEVGPRPVPTDTGLVDVSEDQAIDEEPLAFACGQVDVALMAALASDAGNGLTETSVETVLIKSALDKHGSQPSVVATSFWNACMSLNRQIGDVYPETTALVALQNTLYVSVEELCAQNEVIRDRIGRLAALETRRYPTEDEREDIKSVPGVVEDLTTPRAQAELQEIVDIVVATEKPPRVWRARLVNWVTVLGQIIDTGQKNEKRVDWLIKLGGRIAKWFVGLE